MSIQLPVVDFSCLSVDKSEDEIQESTYSVIGDKLIEVFSSIGFVYLSHHGVSTNLLDLVEKESGKFFKLPPSIKEQYRNDAHYGWVSMEQERLNPQRPGDIKESFNIQGEIKWPENEVPEFRKSSNAFLEVCARLSRRILKAMGAGLKLEDPNYFVERHKINDQTTLRYLYYPPVQEETKPGQIRCGEHSDYGSITLLFQDNMGGLQVFCRNGEWLDAVPTDGTVLVNIGDMMQRWTSDKLVSTKHRVVIPEAETKKRQPRRSTVYFVIPDDDSMITCIDGSNKYEPITSADYIVTRSSKSY